MIKQFLALFWGFFDALFFLIALIFANIFAYSFGIRWLWLSLAISSVLIALASEMLAQTNEQGGKS
ncbi:DUF1056 family protein [Fructobacillus sp. CRL 2054]|uniref:DUF1056 family protein n=1 Tax=Fructobacillus sp. CRL 2054 TaxID=2763007 RepID=UPI0023792536|nr:DUF1056 family protein [Fructobacillus sp. CRL 2054]MDD9138320.1 DUF1056 family protein [Fructobacillus sp. CRL 2054]